MTLQIQPPCQHSYKEDLWRNASKVPLLCWLRAKAWPVPRCVLLTPQLLRICTRCPALERIKPHSAPSQLRVYWDWSRKKMAFQLGNLTDPGWMHAPVWVSQSVL